MRFSKITLFILLIALGSSHAFAAEPEGRDVLIPVVSRTPGAEGSIWRTDLVVSNVAQRGVDMAAVITLTRAGFPDQTVVLPLPWRASIELRDVLLETFGVEKGVGLITIRSTEREPVSARARIYNVGSATGEYGQVVPGVAIADLPTTSWVNGLTGLDGNRSNLGLSNPFDVDVPVFLSLHESSGESRGGFSILVPARSVVQYNDVFAWFGKGPLRAASVRLGSSLPVYSYGSVVRAGTGDADFVVGVPEIPRIAQ